MRSVSLLGHSDTRLLTQPHLYPPLSSKLWHTTGSIRAVSNVQNGACTHTHTHRYLPSATCWRAAVSVGEPPLSLKSRVNSSRVSLGSNKGNFTSKLIGKKACKNTSSHTCQRWIRVVVERHRPPQRRVLLHNCVF